MVEPIEPRRLLSSSLLSVPPDQPSDAQNVMASFVQLLSDVAAQQYAPPPPSSDPTPMPVSLTAAPAAPTGTLTATAPTVNTVRTQPRPPKISPDLNGDGVVNADDLALYTTGLARYQSGAIPPGTATPADGDATGDGIVNTRDYLLILTAMQAPTSTPPDTSRVLVPGSGAIAPIPQPAAVGTPGQPGYDEKAIARWDVVPYQTFHTSMNVGLLAYHMTGIDRVEFTANGGRPVAVRSMATNPQTGISEYFATLDPSKIGQEGPVVVCAVAYPKVGLPRVLKSLPLNFSFHPPHQQVRWVSPTGSNLTGDGSQQNPFQTIKQAAMSIQAQSPEQNVDDALIYLTPGEYAFSGGWDGSPFATPLTEFTWLTISAAPGVPVDQARITTGESADRLNASLVHLANLTLDDTTLVSSTDLNLPAAIWFDHCTLASIGPTNDVAFASSTAWTGGVYATDTLIHDVANGLSAATFERNVHVTNVGSDAFQNVTTLVNCSVDSLSSGPLGAHPDVVQFYAGTGTIENRILYGLTATSDIVAQGIFAGSGFSLKDIAIVNCNIDNDPNLYYSFQFCGPTRHMLVSQSSFTGPFGGAWRVDAGFTAQDVFVANTTFSHNPGAVPGVTYQ